MLTSLGFVHPDNNEYAGKSLMVQKRTSRIVKFLLEEQSYFSTHVDHNSFNSCTKGCSKTSSGRFGCLGPCTNILNEKELSFDTHLWWKVVLRQDYRLKRVLSSRHFKMTKPICRKPKIKNCKCFLHN